MLRYESANCVCQNLKGCRKLEMDLPKANKFLRLHFKKCLKDISIGKGPGGFFIKQLPCRVKTFHRFFYYFQVNFILFSFSV